jgi:phasin family protein
MTMQNDLLDQWGKVTKATIEALKEFGEISTRLVERLAQTQLEAVNTSLEAGVRGTQLVGQARDYNDYFARQSALAAEYGERFLQITRKANKVVTDGYEELTAWVERQVDTSANGAKASARKAA